MPVTELCGARPLDDDGTPGEPCGASTNGHGVTLRTADGEVAGERIPLCDEHFEALGGLP